MEEILASIRRIIADDQSAAAKPAPVVETVTALHPAAQRPRLVEAPPVAPADAHAPISRGEGAQAWPPPLPRQLPAEPPAPPPVPPLPRVEAAPSLSLAPLPLPELDRAPVATEAPAEAPEEPPLLSDEAGESIAQSFGALAHTHLAQHLPPLEDVIREMLRPMLKNWLDDNLPTIVEKLVRAEIERVARGGRG